MIYSMDCHHLPEKLVNALMRTASTKSGLPLTGVAYNLAAIALVILVLALGIAYVIDQKGRTDPAPPPDRADTTLISQTVAGRELAIPQTWFRTSEAVQEGFSQQVELKFALTFERAKSVTLFDVTLLPLTRARASSALLDTVYVHQFQGALLQTVPGLVGKTLKPADGYAGEVVWYDALAPQPFVAKCSTAPTPERASRCVRTVHLSSGLAAIVSFNEAALTHWREFDSQMALWLDQIGAL
jgi:hypothetical protein